MSRMILFMNGFTHEMSLVPVEIDDSQFARELAEQNVIRLRRNGNPQRLRGSVERDILSTPIFTKTNLQLGGANGLIREISEEEATALIAASEAYVAKRNSHNAPKAPLSLIALGLACASCGHAWENGRSRSAGECPRCGA